MTVKCQANRTLVAVVLDLLTLIIELEMSIPMPLSSFSKIGDKYVIFGALSIGSTFDDIEHELAVLSNNAIEIIDDMSDYLV